MKIVHLIVVGDESVDQHLAGVSILGARRVILFDIKNMRRERTEELQGKLKEMVIPSDRVGTEGEEYRDIYSAGRAVFEGCLAEKGICFAINLSAGSRMALVALEDALRIPVEQPPQTPAFRYEVMPGDKKGVRIAPLTFPPVPLITPKREWVKYMGFRERAFTLFRRFRVKWLHLGISARGGRVGLNAK